MITIHNSTGITIKWTIYRDVSDVRENFSSTVLKIFAIGRHNKFPLLYDVDTECVTVYVPVNMPTDTYCIEAIWLKNPRRTKIPLYTYGGISYSRVDDVFSVTSNTYEVTDEGNISIKIKSHVATYGYDGLGAYELAVMRGETGDLGQWLDAYRGGFKALQEAENKAETLIEEYSQKKLKVLDASNLDAMTVAGTYYVERLTIGSDVASALVRIYTDDSGNVTQEVDTYDGESYMRNIVSGVYGELMDQNKAQKDINDDLRLGIKDASKNNCWYVLDGQSSVPGPPPIWTEE